jgi:hypothetical protein
MPEQPKKRPPRQPLSAEEVQEFIRLKKFRQRKVLERFRKTLRYKILNGFNIFCVIIYSELIIAFLGICHYNGHYIGSINSFYSRENKGGKVVCSSIVINSIHEKIYDVSINDTITAPAKFTRFLVGKDWILQKEVNVRLEGIKQTYIIKDAFPILFISCLLGITTFISFGYNLNQVKYSLMATSLMNGLSLFSFLLL